MSGIIAPMRPDDWPVVRRIYAEGIASGHATFETTVPDWEQWDSRHLKTGRLVWKPDAEVAGWAALSQVSSRPVYSGVAEVSVYVAAQKRGKGGGSALLGALIETSEDAGLWTLQASIFAENQASLRLHEKHSFRFVGRRERIGCHHGIWRDTLLLERRSARTG